jgi:MoaA/NifB/PqqE/SkfB family radical SAM enzyme
MSKENFVCAFAWAGIEVSSVGGVRPCCVFEDDIKDNNGVPVNIKTHSISEIVNSNYLKNLRQQMLNNEKPAACAKCWKGLDHNKAQTLRNNANNFMQLDHENLTTNSVPLQFLGLAMGNICNLKCRICGPWASSVWAVDEIKRRGFENSQTEVLWLKDGAWPQEAELFWKDVEQNVSAVSTISIYGGEPFLDQRHVTFLERLVELDQAKNITLWYSTNGTSIPQKLLSVFNSFGKVLISFSLDDIGARFDYQRKNANWQEVVENVNYLSKMTQFVFKINCTVSVFNVLYLDEIVTEFKRLWPQMFLQFNLLRNPQWFSALYAPNEFKQELKNSINFDKFKHYEFHTQLKSILDVIHSEPHNLSHWNKLIDEIQAIDEFRSESIQDDHKKLAKYLKIS